jgi:hypothetical protein
MDTDAEGGMAPYLSCICATAILCLLTSCGQPELSAPEEATSDEESLLAVKGPTLIDVRTGSRSENVTILLEAGHIVEIQPSAYDEVPAHAGIIDARGKYVIPGLWDVHTHIQTQDELDLFFPLLVAHGVLGVRDAGGLLPEEFAVGAARHEHAPRVVAAGPLVDGPAPAGEDDAAIVDALVAKGVGYIKVFSQLPRERFIAIAKRAEELGIHVAGHVPVAVNPAEASDAGLRTMEHFLEVHLSVSENEQELRQARLAQLERGFTSLGDSIRALGFPPLEPLLVGWSDDKASVLFRRLAANRTWQVPTLADFRAWAKSGEPSFWQDERLSLLPESWLASWRTDQHSAFSDMVPAELPAFYAHLESWYQAQLDLTRRMHEAGVGFLAGTDTSAWNFQVPGAAVHDELALFVEAGFTPLEALQTATVNVAAYLEIEGYDGTVSVGQAADFVLLDADPLLDIRNTTQISGIVFNGYYIDADEIDRLLGSGTSPSDRGDIALR